MRLCLLRNLVELEWAELKMQLRLYRFLCLAKMTCNKNLPMGIRQLAQAWGVHSVRINAKNGSLQ